METTINFNLNQSILVKLTKLGYQHLADLHNSLCQFIPNLELTDADFYESQADESGYTQFAMWEFMQSFGSVTHLSGPSYYEIDIILLTKS